MNNLLIILNSLYRTWQLNNLKTKFMILTSSFFIGGLEVLTINLITLEIVSSSVEIKKMFITTAIIAVIFFALKIVLNYLQYTLIYKSGIILSERIFNTLTEKIINPLRKSEKSTDAITLVTNKINNLITQQITPMVQIITAIVVLGIFFIQFVYLYKFYSMIILLAVIPLSSVAVLLFKFTSKQSKIINKSLEDVTSSSLEAFENSYSALVNGLGPFLYSAFKMDNLALRRSQMLLTYYSSFPRVIFETTLFGLALLFIFSGGSIKLEDSGILAVSGLMIYRSLPYIASVIQNLMLVSGNADTFRSICEQMVATDKLEHGDSCETEIPTSIQINNFKLPWVKYDVDFNGLTAFAAVGEPLIIKGRSGCGKSTLLRTIMGKQIPDCDLKFFDDDKNEVKINFPQKPAQGAYAFFEPSFMLFTASLVENVTGKKETLLSEKERKRLTEVLKIVDLHNQTLEWKSFTNLIDCGLSTGQVMRLGLARALFKDAAVYILDEPTANLDAVVAQKVVHGVINFLSDKLLIVATHEPELWSDQKQIDCSFLSRF